MAATEKQKESKKEEKKEAPVVRVRSRGQVSSTLERFAEIYRAQNEGRDVRYVYDPTHRPELSGVMGRRAMGYETVTFGQIGEEGPGQKADDPVRVGDLVLMSIGKEAKEAIRQERAGYAKDRAQSVQRQFYDEIEKAANESTPSHHSGPAARPLGRAVIEERELSYDVKQREE